jgi:hypothetical protein
VILRHPHIDAPGRDAWRHGFALWPVRLWDGTLIVGRYEWRYSFTSLVGSYHGEAKSKPMHHKTRRMPGAAQPRFTISLGAWA